MTSFTTPCSRVSFKGPVPVPVPVKSFSITMLAPAEEDVATNSPAQTATIVKQCLSDAVESLLLKLATPLFLLGETGSSLFRKPKNVGTFAQLISRQTGLSK